MSEKWWLPEAGESEEVERSLLEVGRIEWEGRDGEN